MARIHARTWRLIAIVLAITSGVLLVIAIRSSLSVGAESAPTSSTPPDSDSSITAAPKPAPTPTTSDPLDLCAGTWPSTVVTQDYLVIGGGPGGSATFYDLVTAIKASPVTSVNSLTVGLIEARDRIGGNFWDVDLVKPTGYNVTNAPLRIGLGGLRVNMLTLLNERRMFSELNIPLIYTPFRQEQFTRGRHALCSAPVGEPTADPSTEDDTFTEFCSFANTFINESNVDEAPVGSAFVGLGATQPYGDPSFDGWCFLTDSPDYPAADAGCQSPPPHPLTGLPCDDSSTDQMRWCPRKACRQYVDFNSFVSGYLSPEYAYFMQMDNVGFRGDYLRSFDACSYLEWQSREWNTASNNGMPVGGMSQLPIRAVARAQAKGGQVYLSQPATCVRRKPSTTTGTHRYEVRTPNYTFKVNKWVFLAIPNVDLHRKLSGDVINELRAKKETTFARNASVATLSIQWAPDQPAWFYDYLDKAAGNYSLRQYGDLGCFSRLEIWDTPYHRFHNGIRAVYSDFHCKEMWDDLIRRGEARYKNGAGLPLLQAYNESVARILQELRASFPGATIPAPVWVRGATWEHAWYFGEPLRNMTNAQVTTFAMAPLGSTENLCLIGDAWNTKYSGHAESALISSRNCLTQTRFASGTLQSRLATIYNTRDSIIANDYDTLTACPTTLPNEYCGPFGPYKEDGTLHNDFCVGNTGAASGYACTSFGA